MRKILTFHGDVLSKNGKALSLDSGTQSDLAELNQTPTDLVDSMKMEVNSANVNIY
jgi:hypothetical protein